MHKYIFWYRTILLLEKKGVFTQPYFNQHLFLERERRSYFFFCIRDWKLFEEGVFTQPYSIYFSFFFFLYDEATVGTEVLHYDNKKQRGNGKHRIDFLSIRCFCLKEGFFFPALLYIGTSLVSYNVSAWRGGFYTALFHLLQYYIMVKNGQTTQNLNTAHHFMLHINNYFTRFPTVLVTSRF